MHLSRLRWIVRASVLVSGVALATPAFAQAPATTAPAITAEALMATVRTLASDEFQGRGAGTEGGAKARALIRARFEAIGLQPLSASFEQSFRYTPRARGSNGPAPVEVQGTNLVGRCPGTEPSLPAMVLSAHYDHLGVRDGRVYPGADDNASGVATVLEIAALCTKAPFRRDLVLAAFDAEESGLNGARAFVSSGAGGRDRVAVNVNLDMVARGDKGEIYVAGLQHYPALKPLLEPVAARAPIRVLFGHDRPGSGTDDWTQQSDHAAFHAAGTPFVYFGVEDHPDYHQPTDTADKINPDFFARAAGVVWDALRALDAGLR